MNKYGFKEMQDEYLNRIISELPKYDYQRQTKKKTDYKKLIKKTFQFIIMFLLVAAFTLFIVSFEGIINLLIG